MNGTLQRDGSEAQAKVDCLQFHLGKLPPAECPLTHRFTPGMYTRELLMPRGSVVISRVHKTRHPHVMLSGRILVWDEQHGVQELKAPLIGITEPGTRRVAYILEDCRWVTFHATDEVDLDTLQELLTTTPDVSYVGESGEAPPDILRQLAEAAAKYQLPEVIV